MTYTTAENLVAQTEIPTDGTLSRTEYEDEHIKVVVFAFDAGQELSEHTAGSPAIIQVLDGRLELTLDGDRVNAEPGGWVHMPAGLPHAVKAVDPTVMLLTLLRTKS